MRVQIRVEIPVWRGPDPLIPMQCRRRGNRRGPRTDPAVGPISPTMGFGDFPNGFAPNKFAKPVVALFAMTLVPHLCRRLAVARHLAQLLGLGDFMGQRLLAITLFAP